MRIVHIASELYPYMKTGGLADAVGALTGALAELGHEAHVFLPGYRASLGHEDAAAAERRLRLKIELGDRFLSGDIRSFSPRPNLTVYLVCREEFFDRRHPYGNGERDYEDNAERFVFFAKAAVEALRLLNLQADIVHSHDWQGALVPLMLREAERRHAIALAEKTVFTIHNIAYQGLFPAWVFPLLNLPAEFFGIDGLEYYGQVNFMKGGILFADRVTTVSPSYAREIQTAEFGCGLEGVVQTRADDIAGLINGVDPAIWNPAVDPLIPARYSTANLSGKTICRSALLQYCQFEPDFAGPVFGMVCRMVEQKGMDLVLANREFFLAENVRLVVLGSGEKRYEDAFRALGADLPRHAFLHARVDETMSHLIEAGSDFFLMPSLFEPCGLNQMYSQSYGTIPIVSRVGGLNDTVIDAEAPNGTGVMCVPTVDGVRGALQRAMALFKDKARLAEVQKRGMTRDFSWRSAVRGYERLYQDAL